MAALLAVDRGITGSGDHRVLAVRPAFGSVPEGF